MFENFIQSYGYYAVFVFACIEGEIAVLTAGFLCRQGLMSLQLVMVVAFFGTLITEQCLFFVGRTYGIGLLEKYPLLSEKSRKILEFLRKYDSVFIFGSRFIYGIRNISPIIIGVAKITPLKFSTLNVPAALIWSVTVAGVGYLFGDLLDTVRGNLEYFQIAVLVILCIGLIFFIYKKNPKRKNKKGVEE